MKKKRKCLCNILSKKGSFLIPTCSIILVVTMLTLVVLTFAQTVMIINCQKDDVRQKLDDYLAVCAINEFNAIKQGAGYADKMDTDELIANAYGSIGFAENVTEVTFGDYKCVMSSPQITLTETDGVRLKVKYDLTITVFAVDVIIPVTVMGKFIRK